MRKETLDWFYTCHRKVSMPWPDPIVNCHFPKPFWKGSSGGVSATLSIHLYDYWNRFTTNYCERNPRKRCVFVKEDGKIGLNSLQCSRNCRLASCFGHVDFCVVDETCCRREGCSVLTPLGKGGATKSDEFSEKFQTAFYPVPPSFSENYIANFL